MKMTSAEANKLIKQLRDQHRLLESQESNLISFVAATTEKIEDVRPAYSYEETKVKYDDIERLIRKIKHALNQFNANTVPEGLDMTIDEVLVFLPQATERLRKLAGMLSKAEKTRVSNAVRINIIEYEYLNYDLASIRRDYEELLDYKNRVMTALDVTNNTVAFEVDL